MDPAQAYSADRSLKGKLRRRYARLVHRRPARLNLDGPVVSFTFDDAPDSAATEGARILEDADARGTFYICAGLHGQDGPMGRYADRGQIARIARRGQWRGDKQLLDIELFVDENPYVTCHLEIALK